MNQIRMQLDNESRNLAAATDDNIHLKAQVEALHSKNINLEAKVCLQLTRIGTSCFFFNLVPASLPFQIKFQIKNLNSSIFNTEKITTRVTVN